MGDITAVPYEARTVSAPLASSWASDAKAFVRGTFFIAAITIVGTVAVVAALMVGVVGAPVVAAALVYVVLRHRRAAGAPVAEVARTAEG